MKNTVQASLITTFRCNAKCKMCDIWRHPTRPDEELDLSYYEKLPPGLRINITGGEPTLRKDIDDIFRILYPKAALLELSTNGYHTDKIVALAKKYPNILIRVSVEGLPALNDAKRGIPDGFDHALRTILELKKTKCRNIGFSVVISPDNYTDLIHLYDLCVALDVELGNSVVHNSWYFHKEDNAISGAAALEQHERFVEALLTSRRRRLKDRLKDYGRAYFNRSIHRRLRGDEPGYRPPCGADGLLLHRSGRQRGPLQRLGGGMDHRQHQGGFPGKHPRLGESTGDCPTRPRMPAQLRVHRDRTA